MVPSLTVIIVNYNGTGLLEDCLGSLKKQVFRDFEVVFVDNGSSDDSIEKAQFLFPGLKIISLPNNMGFARANNLGFAQAQGKFIVLLNNDTMVDPEFLAALVQGVESGPRVGMVAPRILNFFQRDLVDSEGGLLLTPDGIGQGKNRNQKEGNRSAGTEPGSVIPILMPSGCAALWRKEVILEVGGFMEDFFAYCEDADLGLRARWAGWEAVYAPEALVYHKYSRTAGSVSPKKLFFVERNHYWLAVRNFPLRLLLQLPFWTLSRHLLMIYASLTHKGRGEAGQTGAMAVAFLKAHLQAVRGLGRALNGRKGPRRITGRAFCDLLRVHRLPLRDLILKP
jgi:GT2 family glycosyltransferase